LLLKVAPPGSDFACDYPSTPHTPKDSVTLRVQRDSVPPGRHLEEQVGALRDVDPAAVAAIDAIRHDEQQISWATESVFGWG
jgi:hypothetical protein